MTDTVDHIRGETFHGRKGAVKNSFRYSMDYVLLNPDHAKGPRLFSRNRGNLTSLYDTDHGGVPKHGTGVRWVRDVLASHGLPGADEILLLAQPRVLGHVFNPVSIYYCFDADGALDCVVAEITNTPWKERHAYVLPVETARRSGRPYVGDFDKCFHVSPFMAMQRRYEWRFTVPGDDLHVHMDVRNGASSEFDATLALTRRPVDSTSLARVLWRYPLMTAQVVGAIHWQALRLWLKGTPVHTHPAITKGHR